MINISIDEANKKNFSEIARLADENGAAFILENDEPKYILSKYKNNNSIVDADDLIVEEIGNELIMEYLDVFTELAK